ncbi:alpha/beta hydrolase-fold protein [Planctomyces sp. SH-PL14]|uniref:carboxylesterase family protein n=1 Tax=Planctomyces sp. SH-PL14 TaxID=1632864 RepID=UPI00078D7AD6|nr:alpha/beta hydrolase-fold protein [Planctomyces sp. SH-PL14]AMV18021.1 Alpha/beta hydrolase family protein [Planctomyces sp. SH-PL14]
MLPAAVRFFVTAAAVTTALFLSPTVRAAEPAGIGFQTKTFHDDQGDHAYSVYVPPNYTSRDRWPVVLFLHGAGERGTDGVRPTRVGLGEVIRDELASKQPPFPAIVVFPQVPLGGRIHKAWSPDRPAGERALAILSEVEKTYHTDPARRILTGWSMGGFGVWSLATAHPDHWSAILPIAGGGGDDQDRLAALKGARLWAFHGAQDEIVLPEETKASIEALRRAGGSPGFTELPVGHDSWEMVYRQPQVRAWMLSADAPVPESVDWPPASPSRVQRTDEPFETAFIVPQAVGLRLGNDALGAIGHGLPGLMPADSLKGELEPIIKTFDVKGDAYRAEFRGLTFAGALTSADLRACRDACLELSLGLERLTLRVADVAIHSRTLDAQAGPIQVVLGHQRAVPMTIRVRPVIENGKLRLHHDGTSFRVQDDNWYVTRPERIVRRGTGLGEYELTTGIVGGVYLQKEAIEAEIKAVVPRMLAQLEERLALDVPSSLSSLLWPLPVQSPRLRIQPQQLWIDGTGLSVVGTGLIGSSLPSPHAPRTLAGSDITLATLPADAGLSILASPWLVEAGSTMQVEQGMARINVLDLPEAAFHSLATPALWPGLSPERGETQLDVELEILAPMRLELTGGPDRAKNPGDADSISATLVAPVAALTPCRIDGTRLVERQVRFRVEHDLTVRLERPSPAKRVLQTAWSTEPRVTPESPESDVRPVVESFRTAWIAWTTSRSQAEPVKDIEMGGSRLRLQSLGSRPTRLELGMVPPPLRIVNEGRRPFVYRVRTPESYWSDWHDLPPRRAHEYPGGTPIEWRMRNGLHGQVLPGSEIRVDETGPRETTSLPDGRP